MFVVEIAKLVSIKKATTTAAAAVTIRDSSSYTSTITLAAASLQ